MEEPKAVEDLSQSIKNDKAKWILVVVGVLTLFIAWRGMRRGSSAATAQAPAMSNSTQPTSQSAWTAPDLASMQNDIAGLRSEFDKSQTTAQDGATALGLPPGITKDYSYLGPWANDIASFYVTELGRAEGSIDTQGLAYWSNNVQWQVDKGTNAQTALNNAALAIGQTPEAIAHQNAVKLSQQLGHTVTPRPVLSATDLANQPHVGLTAPRVK